MCGCINESTIFEFESNRCVHYLFIPDHLKQRKRILAVTNTPKFQHRPANLNSFVSSSGQLQLNCVLFISHFKFQLSNFFFHPNPTYQIHGFKNNCQRHYYSQRLLGNRQRVLRSVLFLLIRFSFFSCSVLRKPRL